MTLYWIAFVILSVALFIMSVILSVVLPKNDILKQKNLELSYKLFELKNPDKSMEEFFKEFLND